MNANYTNQKNRFADGVEGAAIRFDPTQPIYDASRSTWITLNTLLDIIHKVAAVYANPSIANPVAQLLQTNGSWRINKRFLW